MRRELSEEERYTLYRRAFTTPEGSAVLDDLKTRYLRTSGLHSDGSIVMVQALVHTAQRAVILDIEHYSEVRDEDAGRVRSDSESSDSE